MDDLTAVYLESDYNRIYYPKKAPFSPDTAYPEYIFDDTGEPNPVYSAFRELLRIGGLDAGKFGTPEWNPLADIICPGDRVIIKPNFVLDSHGLKYGVEPLVTHTSIIRCVTDYVIKALRNRGEIIICDTPQMNCEFDKLKNELLLDKLIEYYRKNLEDTEITLKLLDLRKERCIYRKYVVWKRQKLPGDPEGEIIVNLHNRSEMDGIDCTKLYGADYNRNETVGAHIGGNHRYIISKTVLSSDVFISVPKLKVHKKAGITVNLKNLVGICPNKNYLAHFRIGTPTNDGDEANIDPFKVLRIKRILMDLFLSRNRWKFGKYLINPLFTAIDMGYKTMLRLLYNPSRREIFDKNIFSKGNWYGNDTVWRMVLDLNYILLFARPGKFTEHKRRYISFVDGWIGGENEGPLDPDPVKSGVLMFGFNPLVTDTVAAYIMGYPPESIPCIKYGFKARKYKISDVELQNIRIKSNVKQFNGVMKGFLNKPSTYFGFNPFRPHKGWKSYFKRIYKTYGWAGINPNKKDGKDK